MKSGKIGITEGADPTVNGKWEEWVKSGKPAILITKSPRLLMHFLDGEENIIIHCTITGLGRSKLEPRIDTPDISLQYYHLLCDMYGKDRVVLRVDPIIPEWDYNYTPKQIAKEAEGRIRISFIDQYPHVKTRLSRIGKKLAWESFHAPLELRLQIWKDLGEPEVCGEPDLPSIPCVSILDCSILKVKPSKFQKGQRKVCSCLANKTELCKPPPKCTYNCLYCYWK